MVKYNTIKKYTKRDGWMKFKMRNEFGHYLVLAKAYDEGSKYGLDHGVIQIDRVSKLFIWDLAYGTRWGSERFVWDRGLWVNTLAESHILADAAAFVVSEII